MWKFLDKPWLAQKFYNLETVNDKQKAAYPDFWECSPLKMVSDWSRGSDVFTNEQSSSKLTVQTVSNACVRI
jgi:hypothetical protein